jgi:hypothetical protein
MLKTRIGLIALLVIASIQLVRAEDKPASQPAKVPPVDFRKLKEVIPAELGGVKRSNIEGEKISLGEFVMTHAKGEFVKPDAKEGDPELHVEIMDYGSAPGMGDAMAAWQNIEIDKESDKGYERTAKIADQPAYVTYQNESKSGQVQMWVNHRFLLSLNTQNIPGDQLTKTAESLPIAKLAELK